MNGSEIHLYQSHRNLSLVEEELAEIKNDQSLFMMYKESDLNRFSVCVSRFRLNISNKALKILLQFSTTYIFEESFSTMTYIKSMKRESLKCLMTKCDCLYLTFNQILNRRY